MTDQLEQVLEDLEEVLEEGELLELPEAGAVLPRERTGGDAGAPPLLPETAETGEEATAAGGQAAAPPPAQGPARAETEGEEGPSPGRFPEEGTEPPLERRGSPAAGSGEAAVRGLRAALPAGRAEAYGGGAEGGTASGTERGPAGGLRLSRPMGEPPPGGRRGPGPWERGSGTGGRGPLGRAGQGGAPLRPGPAGPGGGPVRRGAAGDRGGPRSGGGGAGRTGRPQAGPAVPAGRQAVRRRLHAILGGMRLETGGDALQGLCVAP